MIITKLNGGLGNQLFQYAAARCLAHESGEELKLDISSFKNDKLRTYELKNFQIIENFAQAAEINKCKYALLDYFKPYYKRAYIKEKHFHYDPNIAHVHGNVFLNGYWQSEKYFLGIKELIRKEFTIKAPLAGLNLSLAKQIKAANAVSVHIRRGDYVTNPATKKYHGICSIEYYQRCIIALTAKIKNPHFFVFSDDAEWTKENLKIDYPTTYITHNGAETAHEDLRLMSLCKHHIIANSSFSWWGAWLNPFHDKLVYAPQNWFDAATNDTKDLLPDTWHKM